MSSTIECMSYAGAQPHSCLATESSRESGHESRYRLPERIDLVLYLETRNPRSYRGGKLGGGEAHGADVEVGVVPERLQAGLRKVDDRLDGVRHVHHGQPGVGTQVAGVTPFADRPVEYRDRVVRGARGRLRLPADDPRQPHSPYVQSQLGVVVVPHQLGEHLGDAVERVGLLYRVVGRVAPGRLGTERRDRAGDHDTFEPVVARGLQHVDETVDVHPVGEMPLGLREGGENRAHVVERVDLVLSNGEVDLVVLGDVDGRPRAGGLDVGGERGPVARRDDVLVPGPLSQGRYELGPDLPRRAGYQYSTQCESLAEERR